MGTKIHTFLKKINLFDEKNEAMMIDGKKMNLIKSLKQKMFALAIVAASVVCSN